MRSKPGAWGRSSTATLTTEAPAGRYPDRELRARSGAFSNPRITSPNSQHTLALAVPTAPEPPDSSGGWPLALRTEGGNQAGRYPAGHTHCVSRRLRAVKARRRHVGASASPALTALAVSGAEDFQKLPGVDTFVDIAVDVPDTAHSGVHAHHLPHTPHTRRAPRLHRGRGRGAARDLPGLRLRAGGPGRAPRDPARPPTPGPQGRPLGPGRPGSPMDGFASRRHRRLSRCSPSARWWRAPGSTTSPPSPPAARSTTPARASRPATGWGRARGGSGSRARSRQTTSAWCWPGSRRRARS